MNIHVEPITIDDVKTYFPAILHDGPNYKYEIEISTFKKPNSKLIAGAHVSACSYKEENGFIMRELFPLDVKCLRAHLDTPLRASSKLLKQQLALKLIEKRDALLKSGALEFNHPYVYAIEKL